METGGHRPRRRVAGARPQYWIGLVLALLCLGLSEDGIYDLGTLRGVFLQRDGGNTFTGDTLTVDNGDGDDFTILKDTTGTGASDLIIKTTSSDAEDDNIILDNKSSFGPQFKQDGTTVGSFAQTINPQRSEQQFQVQGLNLTGASNLSVLAAEEALGGNVSTGLVIVPDEDTSPLNQQVTITTHALSAGYGITLVQNRYWSNVYADKAGPRGNSSYVGIRLKPVGEYAGTPYGTSPETWVYGIVDTGYAVSGGDFIAGNTGIKSDFPVTVRTTNASGSIMQFYRATTKEWTLDSSGNWVDNAGGNLVDTVDMSAHTHVGGGSNGANLGTASVGATQLVDTTCTGQVFIVGADSGAGTQYFWFNRSDADNLGSVTEGNVDNPPIRRAFKVHSLSVEVSPAPDNGAGVQSFTYRLRVNAANSALTCAISETQTSCSDTSNVVSVAAGDRLAWSSVPSGTPTAGTRTWLSACIGN